MRRISSTTCDGLWLGARQEAWSSRLHVAPGNALVRSLVDRPSRSSVANLRVRVPRVEPLDPAGAPGRRFPGIAEVDPLADDLVVAELHDADDHDRVVVVADRVLVDPQVGAAGDPADLKVLAGRIGRPEG